jgi:hypothetical protein
MARRTAPKGGSPFYAASQQLHAAAAAFQPKGMMEVYQEFGELPFAMMEIAAAIQARAEACSPAKTPLNPAITTVLTQIATAVNAAAVSAQQLQVALVALHPELQRLLRPRPAEAMWDTTSN